MNKKVLSLIKLVCIVYLILALPKVISYSSKKTVLKNQNEHPVLIGIENLISTPQKFSWLKKLNLGLVSNKLESFDKNNNRNIDLLLKQGLKVKKIFIPNIAQNKKLAINLSNDTKTNLPIYNWDNNFKLLSQKHLSDISAILFDMADSGLRHDQCFSYLQKTMESAAKNNKMVIVLDRPNPIGNCMEGTGEIPLRTGMTAGENALYLNKHVLQKPANLTVIPMLGWNRKRPLENLKNQQIPKNLTNLNSCYSHSFLSFLKEIKPIKVTADPQNDYQVLLLPEKEELSNWEIEYLKKVCTKLGLFCRNHSYWDKDKKMYYKGIKIRVKKDINKFSAFNSLLTLSRFLKNRKNVNITYSDKFNDMIGSNKAKEFLQGKINFKQLKETTDESLKTFYIKSKDLFLYKPYPKINTVELVRG